MQNVSGDVVAVLAGIITLATIAVIFGSSNSAGVLNAGGSAFAGIIKAAVAPATNQGNGFGSVGPSTGYLGGPS